MNPRVSAKVSKSDVRVPERKSEVSKHESASQTGNLGVAQIARCWQEQVEKKVSSLSMLHTITGIRLLFPYFIL